MGWQVFIVGVAVAIAVAYVAKTLVRMFTTNSGCSKGCGCGGSVSSPEIKRTPFVPVDDLRVRRDP